MMWDLEVEMKRLSGAGAIVVMPFGYGGDEDPWVKHKHFAIRRPANMTKQTVRDFVDSGDTLALVLETPEHEFISEENSALTADLGGDVEWFMGTVAELESLLVQIF